MEPVFTVIVPSYNGGENLPALADELSSQLEDTNGILLFVDDGSTNDTQAVIRSLSMRHPRIFGIYLDRNRGQQCALMAGMQYCRTPWVITMDDDGIPGEAETRLRIAGKILERAAKLDNLNDSSGSF